MSVTQLIIISFSNTYFTGREDVDVFRFDAPPQRPSGPKPQVAVSSTRIQQHKCERNVNPIWKPSFRRQAGFRCKGPCKKFLSHSIDVAGDSAVNVTQSFDCSFDRSDQHYSSSHLSTISRSDSGYSTSSDESHTDDVSTRDSNNDLLPSHQHSRKRKSRFTDFVKGKLCRIREINNNCLEASTQNDGLTFGAKNQLIL